MTQVSPAEASAAQPPGHALSPRGAHGQTTGASTKNLVDHGGPVLPTSHVYVIWWGSSSEWGGSSGAEVGLDKFFKGLNGSSYANTAAQYMRGATLSISVVEPAAVDSSSPPSSVNPSVLGAEVQKEFTQVDPLGVYFVFTSNPAGGGFCAWHSGTIVGGTPVAVAYMPNLAGISGCGVSGIANGYSATTQALANVSAHEFMESITDQLPSGKTYAWISSGQEIGDKCAWQFGPTVTLGSISWQLQEEWSNHSGGCVEVTP